jgi:hypothetical protein
MWVTTAMLSSASKLNARQWRYYAMSILLLPIVDISLKKFGYIKTSNAISALNHRFVRFNKASVDKVVIDDIAIAIGIAARRTLWPTSCLRQALLLSFFLSRKGIESELHIGVRKDQFARLDAHAWVTYRGEVILGGAATANEYAQLRSEKRV